VTFAACRVFDTDGAVRGRLTEMEPGELSPGDVTIRAAYSGINFKDALAVTGRGKILRRLPLNAGIDVSGTVESSTDPRFRAGDVVLVNGMGLGEVQDGGFAELVRVPAEWIVHLPEGLTPFEAMALGTAGFSAALAIDRMERMGQRPEQGPICVTGASGGVGSIAIAILTALGYRVVAVSGRREHHGYVASLGAHEVVTSEDLGLGSRPLETAKFAGAIDNVGGDLLAALTRHVGLWGNVAVLGNAGSPDLKTTVFPLILRGVNLLGVSSTNCPMDLRKEVWRTLGAEKKPRHLDRIVSRTIPLSRVLEEADAIMERRGRGRVVVACTENR
jgi:NADPH2:quinone reductase